MSSKSSAKRIVRWSGTVLAVTLAAIWIQDTVRTQSLVSVPFAKQFLVTGNYTVGSVDLLPASQRRSGGFITSRLAGLFVARLGLLRTLLLLIGVTFLLLIAVRLAFFGCRL